MIKDFYVHLVKAGPKCAPIGSQIEFRSSNKSPNEWSTSCQKILSAAQEPSVHCAGILLIIKGCSRDVFRTFELRVLTVIDCPKIVVAKGRSQ